MTNPRYNMTSRSSSLLIFLNLGSPTKYMIFYCGDVTHVTVAFDLSTVAVAVSTWIGPSYRRAKSQAGQARAHGENANGGPHRQPHLWPPIGG